MIQIDRNPADRSGESGRAVPAAGLAPYPRILTSTADDERPVQRPVERSVEHSSLFVVPPPQPVWPRVFPGL
jgi:hypothetical protein